jgi:hypothetical protein
MDFRDAIEIFIGFFIAVMLATVVYLLWGQDHLCKVERDQITSLKETIVGQKMEIENRDQIDEAADRESEKKYGAAIEETLTDNRIIEVCINKVLHYRSNGAVVPRWNVNGTLIKCDFGKFNKTSMPEPDIK